MLRPKRKSDDDEGQGGARPVQPHADGEIELTIKEARALKSLADLGAGDDYVTPKRIASHMLRRLRERDFVILLDHPLDGTKATLTGFGMHALAPALKKITADPGMSR